MVKARKAAEGFHGRTQDELSALMSASRAVLKHRDFAEAARVIFDQARLITGARSGYVALLSEDGEENELLFLEAGGMPCSVNPHLPMPIRGLREVAYRENRTVYDNEFMQSHWVEFMPEGHVVLRNVMFAPLVVEGRTVGIIGLANKEGDFSDRDADMASLFGEFAAIALVNSRNLEQLNTTVNDLKESLNEIKMLQGMIPVCCNCQKIRDDQGYWGKVDAYISKHSHADVTHGICPECAEKLYPGLGKGK